MDRMVKADGEASTAQADAIRAQKALRQLETDVDALRCASHQYTCGKITIWLLEGLLLTTGGEAQHCNGFLMY